MYLHTYMYIGVVGAKCIVVSWRASPSPLQDKASILLLLPLAHFISPCFALRLELRITFASLISLSLLPLCTWP